jgi:hypothetical protein
MAANINDKKGNNVKLSPLNTAVMADQGHLHMREALPILRRDIFNTIADSPMPLTFEQLCEALPAMHSATLRVLLDGLYDDQHVTADKHGRYLATVPKVSA